MICFAQNDTVAGIFLLKMGELGFFLLSLAREESC